MNKIKLSSIIEKQPIINIGCIGHVAHGKSTVVFDLTGTRTQKHSDEVERNITIQLGYANFRIYLILDGETKGKYIHSQTIINDSNYKLIKHYSFTDCPGHQAYMSTMISGSETFNVALMLISASEPIPQPQTISHANVLLHTDINNIAILLNKIDLLTDETMLDSKLLELTTFIESNSKLISKQIIPISAQKKINIDQIVNYLALIPNTDINYTINLPFKMNILRSFNINKINVEISDLVGGIVGGSIKSGYISINDWIVIKPGIISQHKNSWRCRPIFAQVKSIQSDNTILDRAYPGGLIALGIDCDPAICKNNNLLGNKIYKVDQTNFEEIKQCNDLAIEFTINIEYLKNPADYLNITNIYLLINSSPINGKIISSNNNRTQFVILAEKPFAGVGDNSKISILHKTNQTIDLFAIGIIISKQSSKIKIILPSNIDTLLQILNPGNSLLEIEDDISNDIIDDLDKVNLNLNLKDQIMKYIKPKVQFKMTLPQPEFKIEPTRIDWLNAGQMIDKLDLSLNSELICEINDSIIKWINFGKMIVKYFNYVYSSDKGLADLHEGRIILHIKRNIKNKPSNVISKFIKDYYICTKCKSLTSRIGKIGSQYASICVLCDNRILIHDEWIK